MTHATKRAPRRAAIPAAGFALFLLTGCSSGNIGESWQCPLAKGGSCDSVAAADPAVPDAGAARKTVLTEPLWRVRGDELPEVRAEAPPARGEPAPASEPGGQACATECDGGFDPIAWLARLFGESNDGGDDRSAARQPEPAAAGKTGTVPAGPEREADPAASSIAPEAAEALAAEPEAAALPAEPVAVEVGPQADDLRTDEVVARIWIAPFVDANGVYREASHVRVVLEPAGWRLK